MNFKCQFAAPLLSSLIAATAAAQSTSVTTHHYDNLRTGWNPNETALTPAAVSGGSFKALQFVTLDDQVDAQPLLVPSQTIAGQGLHDVVYVATENNSVYALDAASGAVLLSTNLGAPVPQSALPGQCNNNAANVGIGGTPVIDPVSGTLYVIAYTTVNGAPVYTIHALNIDTLKDKVTPVVVKASGVLNNGQTYEFNAASSRQRAALLLANGNVYAGFASFCDNNANLSRGWILGWQAGTLTALPGNELTDKQATSPDDFFLTTIWMSGHGLAASATGDIYFVTGNTDYNGKQFNHVTNIAESAVQLSADLTTVKSIYTPADHSALDEQDDDFGSGGLTLLPPQSVSSTNLAVAAGKNGIMYLLNADTLRNHAALPTGKALSEVRIGGCWCGQSYYTASDGFGRVVSSGGANVILWKVVGGSTAPLVKLATSTALSTGQSGGFFTTVSSNGTSSGTAVIWGVGRPVNQNPAQVNLYAFNESGNQLLATAAGTWPNTGGNANIVPVVANGRVYVASYRSLAIFGLGSGSAAVPPVIAAKPYQVTLPAGIHEIYGTVRGIDGATVLVERRTGAPIKVDAAAAFADFQAAQPSVGHGILIRGSIDEAGVVHAQTLLHAKDASALWPADR